MLKALVNEDHSISADIDRDQSVLEHALSKVDFYPGIYILPSNIGKTVEKTVGYNNKILISNTNIKIGPGKDINKSAVYHKNRLWPYQNPGAHMLR